MEVFIHFILCTLQTDVETIFSFPKSCFLC